MSKALSPRELKRLAKIERVLARGAFRYTLRSGVIGLVGGVLFVLALWAMSSCFGCKPLTPPSGNEKYPLIELSIYVLSQKIGALGAFCAVSALFFTGIALAFSLPGWQLTRATHGELSHRALLNRESSPEIRWALALAAPYTELDEILDDHSRQFYQLDPGADYKANCQNTLEHWWGITDHSSLVNRLEWLLTCGHRQEFAQQTDENVAGWGFVRFVHVVRLAYCAGYITRKEAYDQLLLNAGEARKSANSWQELGESWLRGRELWSEEEGGQDFRDIIHRLLTHPNSPWVELPWSMASSR